MEENTFSIPCEICNELIPFADYMDHLEICQHRTSVLNILNPMLNSFLQSQDTMNLGLQSNTSLTFRTLNVEDLLDSYEMNSVISEFLGSVPTGCSNFDTVVVSNLALSDIPESNLRCPICLVGLDEVHLDSNVCRTVCDHYFCLPSITKWLSENHRCPLCNSDFNA